MKKFVIVCDCMDIISRGNGKSFHNHQIGDELADIETAKRKLKTLCKCMRVMLKRRGIEDIMYSVDPIGTYADLHTPTMIYSFRIVQIED